MIDYAVDFFPRDLLPGQKTSKYHLREKTLLGLGLVVFLEQLWPQTASQLGQLARTSPLAMPAPSFETRGRHKKHMDFLLWERRPSEEIYR